MKMKLITLLAATLLAVSSARAGSVTVFGNIPENGPGSGGAFSAVADIGTFTAFCLERGIELKFGVPYTYTLNRYATPGGQSGQEPALSNQDPLSAGSVWLMTQYANGALVGYTYDSASGEALQQAFWFLEGENATISPLAQSFLNAAYLATGGAAAAQVTAANFGNVWVMNLFQGEVGKQDIIVYIPDRVPDSGTTLLLLGCSLGLVGFVSRRFRR